VGEEMTKCKQCNGNIPKTKRTGTLFCHSSCCKKYHNHIKAKKRKDKRKVALCKRCGEPFKQKNSLHIYCHKDCRNIENQIAAEIKKVKKENKIPISKENPEEDFNKAKDKLSWRLEYAGIDNIDIACR
jgi:uncharacterized lipoprotein YddW (UPF0748 family)